jgi:hypothetical protein
VREELRTQVVVVDRCLRCDVHLVPLSLGLECCPVVADWWKGAGVLMQFHGADDSWEVILIDRSGHITKKQIFGRNTMFQLIMETS